MSGERNTGWQPERDARPWLLLISLVAIALDRLTKMWIVTHVAIGGEVTVIPGIFSLTHVLNTGAAFSFLADSAAPSAVRSALISFSLAAAAGVLAMLWRYGKGWSLSAIGLSLVLGGAVGNLYDRLILHSVIDFLYLHIAQYSFWDFNVADTCISVGAALLALEMIWHRPKSQEDGIAAGDLRGA